LAFDVLEVMLRAKTADRAFLVSDSTELAGHQPGQYRTAVGGGVELSPDGRLSFGTTGLLAGAALPVTAGLRNVVAHTSFSLAAAVRMVTRTPARLLLGVEAGELRIGAPADLVLLDDAGAVLKVMTAGRWLGN
jgi:N-acetylglucosamine-6-phosphate deacetylase